VRFKIISPNPQKFVWQKILSELVYWHLKMKTESTTKIKIKYYIFLVGAHVLEALVRNLKLRRNNFSLQIAHLFLLFTGVVVVVEVDVLVVEVTAVK
jgi:hypothetical protein